MTRPTIALMKPDMRRFLMKQSKINPLSETRIKKIAERSITHDHPFPESLPL